jgi:hypothetical protein
MDAKSFRTPRELRSWLARHQRSTQLLVGFYTVSSAGRTQAHGPGGAALLCQPGHSSYRRAATWWVLKRQAGRHAPQGLRGSQTALGGR